MKEPETDEELQAALTKLGVTVTDEGGYFIAKDETGSCLRLDAEDWSNALFEAWNTFKP